MAARRRRVGLATLVCAWLVACTCICAEASDSNDTNASDDGSTSTTETTYTTTYTSTYTTATNTTTTQTTTSTLTTTSTTETSTTSTGTTTTTSTTTITSTRTTTTVSSTTSTTTYNASVPVPFCADSLLDAVLAAQAEEVKRYAVLGLDLNCRKDNEFLLQLALRSGQEEMAQVIASSLRSGMPHLMARNATGATPLLMAADHGFTVVVVTLLNHGVPSDVSDMHGHNALHLAAPFANASEAFLSHRIVSPAIAAQVLFAHDDAGQLPIHYAMIKAATPEVAFVNVDALLRGTRRQAAREALVTVPAKRKLSVEALVNAPGAGGNRPVHLTGHFNTLSMLHQLGAKIDAEIRNDARQTALHTVAMWPGVGVNGALAFAAELVTNASVGPRRLQAAAPVSINDVDVFKRTPLHYGSATGDAGNVRWLVSRGADPTLRDANGNTPLEFALTSLALPEMKVMVRTFMDFGGSPLQSVVRIGAYDLLVDLVLNSGNQSISVHSRDPTTGRTALFEAAETGNTEMMRFFVDQGADVSLLDLKGLNPLAAAAAAFQAGSIKYLVTRGASVSQRLRDQATALHFAAEAGCAPCVEVLLQLGAAVNAVDTSGRTALHVCRGAAAAEALLAAGAALLPTKDLGLYAPHFAAYGGRADVLRMLLAWRVGGDDGGVSLRSLRGDTPLHLAAAAGKIETVKELLRWCSPVHDVNDVGHTALALAADAEVQSLLSDDGAYPARCQCDCGPYQPGALYSASGWAAGCSAQVVCLASPGQTQKVRCGRSAVTTTTTSTAGTNSSVGYDLTLSGGSWLPPRPSFECRMVASGSLRAASLTALGTAFAAALLRAVS